ncbi:MAG TPA: STAS domain-containing protein [Anaeromyxobacter sp.]|nr:STAS domain-containing protein [Anaeromyxobacter sp.]
MRTDGATVIRMDGVFDVPAAQRLARALAQTDEGEQVRIDLTQVREFHDYGVTVLAQALASRGARIAVRGLRQHHLRLLKYFGIDTGGPALGTEVEVV